MYFVDSHIHLADTRYDEYLKMIQRMMTFLNIQSFSMSEDLKSSKKNISIKKNLFQNSDLFKVFVGIHPQNVHTDNLFDEFNDFFISNIHYIDGIGEIGLDPTYYFTDSNDIVKKQKFVFNYMLTIAEKNNKPISIHSRKSLKDVIEILPSFAIRNAVFHWYDGNKKILKKIIDMGFYVSFGPYLLYSIDKQMLLVEVDRRLLLVETDGPVNYRHCFNNVLTSPSMIISIINFMSNKLKISFDELTELLYKNSKNFFI